MVIPLLGVKTRCADKSAAEHYNIHTYMATDFQCKQRVFKYSRETVMFAYLGECKRKWYAQFSIKQRIADHACVK